MSAVYLATPAGVIFAIDATCTPPPDTRTASAQEVADFYAACGLVPPHPYPAVTAEVPAEDAQAAQESADAAASQPDNAGI